MGRHTYSRGISRSLSDDDMNSATSNMSRWAFAISKRVAWSTGSLMSHTQKVPARSTTLATQGAISPSVFLRHRSTLRPKFSDEVIPGMSGDTFGRKPRRRSRSRSRRRRKASSSAEVSTRDMFLFAKRVVELPEARKVILDYQPSVESFRPKHRDFIASLLQKPPKALLNMDKDAALAEVQVLQKLGKWFKNIRAEERREVMDKEAIHLSDMTRPEDEFKLARSIKRSIHLHVGPTNSGKTHTALEALIESSSGVYCGPLRLLAWEVHEKLNGCGVPTDLITGQERDVKEDSRHVSSTVEMVDLTRIVECAVIDEIQMIGDVERGDAWTTALLGIPAIELHLCGHPSVVGLIEALCKRMGDDLTIHRYERLSPLKVESKHVTSVESLQEGDCIVTFSRRDIFKIKKDIEKGTGHKCSVVYGSLPPETRKQQADTFNRRIDGHALLVASDAIGLGLNLNIRRVIFNKLSKFDGYTERPLRPHELQQIAGRAGRFGTENPVGLISTLMSNGIPKIKKLMEVDQEVVRAASISPTYERMELYARRYPDKPLKFLFEQFARHATTDDLYFLGSLEDMKTVAHWIEEADLSLRDRFTICFAPTKTSEPKIMWKLHRFAVMMGEGVEVPVSTCALLLDEADAGKGKPPLTDMRELENAHQILDLYVWLAYRFRRTFVEMDRAKELKVKCEELINIALENGDDGHDADASRRRRRKARRLIRKRTRSRAREEDGVYASW